MKKRPPNKHCAVQAVYKEPAHYSEQGQRDQIESQRMGELLRAKGGLGQGSDTWKRKRPRRDGRQAGKVLQPKNPNHRADRAVGGSDEGGKKKKNPRKWGRRNRRRIEKRERLKEGKEGTSVIR